MFGCSRVVLSALVAIAAMVLTSDVAPAAVVEYRPPVEAPIVDSFRPPPTPYGRGNRGVEYDTRAGEPVLAAAAGVVTFAGRVGFSRHVVVAHSDGIRTSYSFLSGIAVRRGQRVRGGDRLGGAGDTVHVGARIGDRYIDPLRLFGRGLPAHLVDDPSGAPSMGPDVADLLTISALRPAKTLVGAVRRLAWAGGQPPAGRIPAGGRAVHAR